MDEETESRFHTTFIELTENLESKHLANRQKGIQTLTNTLRNHYAYHDLIDHKETVLGLLLKSVARGNESETPVACDAIGLMFITLGPSAEDLRGQTLSSLKTALGSSTPSHKTKAKILQTLAMAEFVTGDSVETIETLDYIGDFFSDPNRNPTLIEGAITAWSFLVTSVDPDAVVFELIPKYLRNLGEYLFLEHHELRLASGECLSILIDLCRSTEDFNVALWDGYCDLPSIIDTLDVLSNECTHSFSKKELKTQRKTFREYSAVISGTATSVETLKCGRQTIDFEGSDKTKQLDGIRAFLGSGLIRHFTDNTFLHDVFGNSFESDEPIVSRRERTYEKSVRRANDKQNSLNKSSKMKQRMLRNSVDDDF